jgi:hypothetical protein
MKTPITLAPFLHAGRAPYPFDPALYQLCVQKVDVQSAPGGGVLRRVVKIVFAVFTQGPDGRLVRCAQDRIATFVILILTKDGTWEPLGGDRCLLAALGAPECLNSGDNVEKILLGRWIEGRPGQADPQGFNALVDYRPINPPPLWMPSGSPPTATPSPARETDAPHRPGARNPLRDAQPLNSPPEQGAPEPARGTPRQSRRLEDERTQIGLVAASEFYNVPKSVLSKAAAKNPGERGYLPSTRKGRRVFFDREDIQNFSRSRKQMKRRSKVADLTSVSRLFRQD